MSTIRIDKNHLNQLDKLIAILTLRGKKITKKDLIGKLIEEALVSEGYVNDQTLLPVYEDPAWFNIKNTYDTGFSDLSENVDKYLYDHPEG